MKANLIQDLDKIIDRTDIVLAKFKKGKNKKKLIVKPLVDLARVEYNLGGGSMTKHFQTSSEAIEFYNDLKF